MWDFLLHTFLCVSLSSAYEAARTLYDKIFNPPGGVCPFLVKKVFTSEIYVNRFYTKVVLKVSKIKIE